MKKLGKKTVSVENVGAYAEYVEVCACKCICMPDPDSGLFDKNMAFDMDYASIPWD